MPAPVPNRIPPSSSKRSARTESAGAPPARTRPAVAASAGENTPPASTNATAPHCGPNGSGRLSWTEPEPLSRPPTPT